MSSFLSRFTAALTVGIGGAFASGLVNPKTALYISLGTAMLQAFQAPVQQNNVQNKAAAEAVAQAKTV